MVILRKLDTNDSFEVSWIYNRGIKGLFLLVEKAKGKINTGDSVALEKYSPKLEKRIVSITVHVETNPINNNVCLSIKNKDNLMYFKRAIFPTAK